MRTVCYYFLTEQVNGGITSYHTKQVGKGGIICKNTFSDFCVTISVLDECIVYSANKKSWNRKEYYYVSIQI